MFDIPIQAVLPQHDLSLPKHLDFGMCASMHHLQRTFELSNTRYAIEVFVGFGYKDESKDYKQGLLKRMF